MTQGLMQNESDRWLWESLPLLPPPSPTPLPPLLGLLEDMVKLEKSRKTNQPFPVPYSHLKAKNMQISAFFSHFGLPKIYLLRYFNGV